MENPSHKNENIERKYLSNMRLNQSLMVENNLLELEKNFIELKHREFKYREVKIKREIEELFFKPIIMSIGDMDKFEQREMKEIRPIKIIWYDLLINYIPVPTRKSVGGFKIRLLVFLRQIHLNKRN